MKQSKTTIKELMKRYRAVLLKCAMINAALFLASPAMAISDPPYTIPYFIIADTQNEHVTNEHADIDISYGFNLAARAGKELTIDANFTGASMISVNVLDSIRSSAIPTNWEDAEDNAAIAAMENDFADLTGTVILNGSVGSGFQGYNIGAGSLKLGGTLANGEVSFLGAYGGTLDLQNGQAGDNLKIYQMSGHLPVAVDFDASTGAMDKLTITQAEESWIGETTSSVRLVAVNVTADGNATSGTWMVRANWDAEQYPLDYEIAGTLTDATSGQIIGTMTTSGNVYIFEKTADGVVSVRLEGTNVPTSETLATAIQNSQLTGFSMHQDFTVSGDLGSLASASFTIFGGGHTVNGADHAGVTVGSGKTLTVQKTTMSGFSTAITNAGTTNIVDSVFNSPISNTGTVNILGTVRLNSTISGGTVAVASTGTLILGENAGLSASTLSGGTIKMTLPATTVASPIISAGTVNSVTLNVDMSAVSRETATSYALTSGTDGYTFEGNYGRYAFSAAAFTAEEYQALTDEEKQAYTLNNVWGSSGGTMYVLRLASSGEAAIEDIRSRGINITPTQERAAQALEVDEAVLAPAARANVARLNAMLDSMAGNVGAQKQILREIAPEAAPAVSQTATSNANAVISVVGTRMGGGSPAPATKGQSGGDYTAGASSVWAQGMYNKAKLHKADGFDSDSTGFAAGFEYNIDDSTKAGIGYAFTNTDIDTDRSKTDVDTHTMFVYGEYKPEEFYVNGVFSYGYSKYDEKTRLAGLKSDYRAKTFAMQAMAGYDLGDFAPEAGLRYTGVHQKAYTNALGARLAGKTLNTWTAVAGAKASRDVTIKGTTVTPDVKLALTYDFKRDAQNRTVTLANGASYVAEGDNMKRFGVEVGAGLSFKAGDTDIGLSYEGKFKEHYTDHTGMINVKYNF